MTTIATCGFLWPVIPAGEQGLFDDNFYQQVLGFLR